MIMQNKVSRHISFFDLCCQRNDQKNIGIKITVIVLDNNGRSDATLLGTAVRIHMLSKLMGNISDEEVRNAIERVGLDPDDGRTYRKYSLGMKQKLGIANAIMGEPDLIILDEPINALDEQTVMSIKTELLKLRDEGKLIVIACHDREELEFLCDIIYEIKHGTVAGCEVIGE